MQLQSTKTLTLPCIYTRPEDLSTIHEEFGDHIESFYVGTYDLGHWVPPEESLYIAYVDQPPEWEEVQELIAGSQFIRFVDIICEDYHKETRINVQRYGNRYCLSIPISFMHKVFGKNLDGKEFCVEETEVCFDKGQCQGIIAYLKNERPNG